MKFKDIFSNEAWKNSFHGMKLQLFEAKPEIMLIGGGIMMLVGTIAACVQK